MNWKRLLLFILVFLFVSILPWWMSVIILAGLTIYIRFYFEVLFFAFLFDILYSGSHTGMIVAIFFIGVVEFVRTKIRT
jgi:hypothetical protein